MMAELMAELIDILLEPHNIITGISFIFNISNVLNDPYNFSLQSFSRKQIVTMNKTIILGIFTLLYNNTFKSEKNQNFV